MGVPGFKLKYQHDEHSRLIFKFVCFELVVHKSHCLKPPRTRVAPGSWHMSQSQRLAAASQEEISHSIGQQHLRQAHC